MKNLKITHLFILAVLCAMLLLACTPAEQQTAIAVQQDLNNAAPLVTEAIETGLSIAGQPAAAALVGAGAPSIEAGQKVILQDLQQNAAPTPATPTVPAPASGK